MEDATDSSKSGSHQFSDPVGVRFDTKEHINIEQEWPRDEIES